MDRKLLERNWLYAYRSANAQRFRIEDWIEDFQNVGHFAIILWETTCD